jgi:hypothetical protein
MYNSFTEQNKEVPVANLILEKIPQNKNKIGTIPASQIQTITAASPIQVSQVSVPASVPTQIPVATISMAHPVQQITKSVTMATVSNVSGTTVQVHRS